MIRAYQCFENVRNKTSIIHQLISEFLARMSQVIQYEQTVVHDVGIQWSCEFGSNSGDQMRLKLGFILEYTLSQCYIAEGSQDLFLNPILLIIYEAKELLNWEFR